MKVLLLYYTGTYNTKYITEIIEKKLILKGFYVKTAEITSSSNLLNLNEFDIIGLGYPIYAFNVPSLYIKYLKKLSFNKNAKYFIYKDSGETLGLNNSSSQEIKHLLKKNKCKLLNEHHFLMPYNIHFRFEDNCIKEMLYYDDKLADILIYELENNIQNIIKSNIFYNINSKIFLIQRFGAKVNHYFYKVDKNKCIQCNKCVNTCPTKNIEIREDGTLKFKNNCIMCMRCSFMCPVNAIKIGLLEKWKVNKPYDFKKIKNDNSLDGHFIKENQKGFFKCYIKTYKKINHLYNAYFK